MLERLLVAIVAGALLALALRLLGASQRRRLSAALGPVAGPQLLFFRGPGCAACALQARYLGQLDARFQPMIRPVDVEREPGLARRYGVLTLPTTILVAQDGGVRKINYGLVGMSGLREQLRAII
ncbi:MAG TPA: thioredoxin family protein [Chloroflexaceae bacterium]|nr:thioredoxin family protein [Chloroflexaceae bacterium]